MNFLPVGHTHEDIDQFFSKISTHLSKVGAETLLGMVTVTVAKYIKFAVNILDLFTVTSESFTPNSIVACLNNLLDIKEWLAPCLNDVHGHTQPHCFKFMLKDSKAVMYYKNWSSCEWREGPCLLKVSTEPPSITDDLYIKDS